jgi:hypothetical protein
VIPLPRSSPPGLQEVDGTPAQVVLETAAVDLRPYQVNCGANELSEALRTAGQYVVDLTTEPLLRATLFAASPKERVLLLLMQSVASDGASTGPLGHIWIRPPPKPGTAVGRAPGAGLGLQPCGSGSSSARRKTRTPLLVQVRKTALTAYMHQDVPFERVAEAVDPTRSPTRHPRFLPAPRESPLKA